MTSVSVVVVGYGDEPQLDECLTAIRSDLREGDDIVLVDNGITALPRPSDVRVVRAESNEGFGAGCNLGAANTDGEVLVFVNSDAVIAPGTIDALREAVQPNDIGLVTGLVVLADRPEIVNAAGNPVHFLGISWAGGYGEPASAHTTKRDVASISGALFAARRTVWHRLNGFDPLYFLYHEDVDLSLRCRLAGLRVTYCPAASARHSYAFDKNPRKMYLLERNRLMTVLTTYPGGLLRRVLPALALTEPLLLAMAVQQGWGRQKVSSWVWLLRHISVVKARRASVQGAATASWEGVCVALDARIDQQQIGSPAALGFLNAALKTYWRLVAPSAVRART